MLTVHDKQGLAELLKDYKAFLSLGVPINHCSHSRKMEVSFFIHLQSTHLATPFGLDSFNISSRTLCLPSYTPSLCCVLKRGLAEYSAIESLLATHTSSS